MDLDSTELKAVSNLDFFKVDPEYQANEEKWAAISKEVLGLDSDEEGGEEGEGSSDDDSDDSNSSDEGAAQEAAQ